MKGRHHSYIIISVLLVIILMSSCDLILINDDRFSTPLWARDTWTGPGGNLIITEDSISGTVNGRYFSTSAILDYPGAYISDIDYGYSAYGGYDYLDLTIHSGYYGYPTSFHITRTDYDDMLEVIIEEGLSPHIYYRGIYYRY